MNTSELAGLELDLEVAKWEGLALSPWVGFPLDDVYCPSTDWSQGGPIIDREKISVLWRPDRKVFWACCGGQDPTDECSFGDDGPTALIAAMRAYVLGKSECLAEMPQIHI